MLKNISYNVKCVKVRYAKIPLSYSFCPVYLDCRENYEHVIGDNSTALSSAKYLLYPKEVDTTLFRSHSCPKFKKKKWVNTSCSSPNGYVHIHITYPSNLCPRSESIQKRIPQEQSESHYFE